MMNAMSLRWSVPGMALGVATMALLSFWSTLQHPDKLIGARFDNAMASRAPADMTHIYPVADKEVAPLASLFRLTDIPPGQHVAGLGAIAVGDRISISGADGKARSLEVLSVSPLPGIADQQGLRTGDFVLVTCRSDKDPGKQVRLIFEDDPRARSAALDHTNL